MRLLVSAMLNAFKAAFDNFRTSKSVLVKFFFAEVNSEAKC
jgi:hypothetical protein